MDVKEEHILGKHITNHWYYISKGRALHQMLSGIRVEEVLDVGAGSGIFSRQLMDRAICNRATCVDPAYEHEYEDFHNGRKIYFKRSIKQTTQELILMMDVLEHVDDDLELLDMYTRTMPQGGYVLVTVPAFQFLWSRHDVFLEHRRRYTLNHLEKVLIRAGLSIARSRYFFASLLPIVAMTRVYNRKCMFSGDIEPRSDLKIYPRSINSLLVRIHDVERMVLFPFNSIAGLTIFCLARRL
jgi:SAM-dependent methyltransferase